MVWLVVGVLIMLLPTIFIHYLVSMYFMSETSLANWCSDTFVIWYEILHEIPTTIREKFHCRTVASIADRSLNFGLAQLACLAKITTYDVDE